MKINPIIEDLDIEFYQNFNRKNPNQKIYDCFLRNFLLIKKYSYPNEQLLLSKFKKKIIPKYSQQVYQYIQQIQQKHRKQYYTKRRISNEEMQTYRKNRINSSQLCSPTIQDQSDKIQQISTNRIIEKPKIQPLLQIVNHKKYQTQTSALSQSPSKQSKQRQAIMRNFEVNKSTSFKPTKIFSQNKIQASIYNDSINFTRKIIFQSTLNKISRTRDQKNEEKIKMQTNNNRLSLNEDQSIQKKMISILKQRKSHTKFKFKMSGSYLNERKLIGYQYANKQNLQKNYQHQNQIVKEAKNKVNMINLALKGKLIIPNKHRISNSCNLQHLSDLKIQDINNKKINYEQKHTTLLCQGYWPLKSSQRFNKTRRQKQLPKIIQNTLQKYKKQKISVQKPFSLPKF